MNNETKIKLIQKSIEDKTGEKILVMHHLGTVFFSHVDKAIMYGKIDESFLQYLPLSDPLEEQPDKGWIPVSEKPKKYIKYQVCFEVDPHDRSIQFASVSEDGKWSFVSSLAQSLYSQGQAKVTHYMNLPQLPSAPVKQG